MLRCQFAKTTMWTLSEYKKAYAKLTHATSYAALTDFEVSRDTTRKIDAYSFNRIPFSPMDESTQPIGAGLKLREVCSFAKKFYDELGLVTTPITVAKLFIDNRNFDQLQNEGLGFQLLNRTIAKPQSTLNCFLVASVKQQESFDSIGMCFKLGNCIEDIPHIQKSLTVLSVCDWVTYQKSDLFVHMASARVGHKRICFACNFNVADKWQGWKGATTFFTKVHESKLNDVNRQQTDSWFSKISIRKRIYDPMHGLSRITGDCITGVHTYLHKLGVMKLTINEELLCYTKGYTINGIRSKECKILLHDEIYNDMLAHIGTYSCVAGVITNYPPPYSNPIEIIRETFKSLKVLFEDIYSKKFCQEPVSDELLQARESLIICNSIMQPGANINPGAHYMINHYYEDKALFSELGIRPVDVINEASESSNITDKKASKQCCSDSFPFSWSKSTCRRMLEVSYSRKSILMQIHSCYPESNFVTKLFTRK